MRRVVAPVVALCGLLALAAPAAAQGGKPAGTLRAVFTSDPPTLDPAQATDTTSSAVVRQIFDTLVELDEQLEPQPRPGGALDDLLRSADLHLHAASGGEVPERPRRCRPPT